jgi:hypothetical protein
MSTRAWVVTPVFHDVPSFLRLRDEILSLADHAGPLNRHEVHFLIADDSAGRDPEMAQLAALDRVHVVTPPFNLGHQRAIVYALRQSRSQIAADDLVVSLDSDGEDRPEDVEKLVTALDSDPDPYAIALARRTTRAESAWFKLLYGAFRVLFRALTGTVIRTGNFAAYRGSLLPVIDRHPYFDLSYSASLNAVGLGTHYVPCPRGTRYAGESRMSVQRLTLHGLSMLVPFTDRIALRAMLVFTATLAASLTLAVVVLAVRLFSDASIPGWATYSLLSLFLVSLVSLGNFVVLFVVFSQSRGVSLGGLEDHDDGR